MIKSLLDADEDSNKTTAETLAEPKQEPAVSPEPEEAEPMFDLSEPFELPPDARFFRAAEEDSAALRQQTLEAEVAETETTGEEIAAFERAYDESDGDELLSIRDISTNPDEGSAPVAEPETEASKALVLAETPVEKHAMDSPTGTLFREEPPPQPIGETIRQSGLAYTAAMVLFGAVVFMMLLGWFADLLIGSSPWGIVGGIILGGFIGFIQFFRIASQIFKK